MSEAICGLGVKNPDFYRHEFSSADFNIAAEMCYSTDFQETEILD